MAKIGSLISIGSVPISGIINMIRVTCRGRKMDMVMAKIRKRDISKVFLFWDSGFTIQETVRSAAKTPTVVMQSYSISFPPYFI